ncbi:MAG: MAPEG family protein [Gammaproteobacteria bacterium]|nr:MAPEG family protein [Gammaproteobacteria bacterium]
MILPITALYAALLMIIVGYLGYKIGSLRGSTGISIFHGDNMEVATAMRRHGNFTENVPMALILMGIVEANGGNGIFLHVMGVALVLARIAHPIGLHHDSIAHPLRAVGALGTFLVMVVLAGMALWQAVGAF